MRSSGNVKRSAESDKSCESDSGSNRDDRRFIPGDEVSSSSNKSDLSQTQSKDDSQWIVPEQVCGDVKKRKRTLVSVPSSHSLLKRSSPSKPPVPSNKVVTSKNNAVSNKSSDVSPKSRLFSSFLKREHGINLGSRVLDNDLFSLYEVTLTGEMGDKTKYLKVYHIENWSQDHIHRVRDFYNKQVYYHINGAPRVFRVIDSQFAIHVLLDSFGMSLYDSVADMNRRKIAMKQMEAFYATVFVQILRAMNRASEKGIYFERLCPQHIFFLNLTNQVIIADFIYSTYLDAKSNSGWSRCKSEITEGTQVICPPELDRLASGELNLEEDSLITGEVWLAGAVVYNLLTNGKYPQYEKLEDGRRKLVVPSNVVSQISNGMKRFLYEVLDFEPEYRPKDHPTAAAHDWVVENRREFMVPKMQQFRDAYNKLIKNSRGTSKKFSKRFTHSGLIADFKGYKNEKDGTRRVMSQQPRHLREGCKELAQLSSLQRLFITDYDWTSTTYEKKILDSTFNGLLLPSISQSKNLIEDQQKRQSSKKSHNDFYRLALCLDDRSQFTAQRTQHMEGSSSGDNARSTFTPSISGSQSPVLEMAPSSIINFENSFDRNLFSDPYSDDTTHLFGRRHHHHHSKQDTWSGPSSHVESKFPNTDSALIPR